MGLRCYESPSAGGCSGRRHSDDSERGLDLGPKAGRSLDDEAADKITASTTTVKEKSSSAGSRVRLFLAAFLCRESIVTPYPARGVGFNHHTAPLRARPLTRKTEESKAESIGISTPSEQPSIVPTNRRGGISDLCFSASSKDVDGRLSYRLLMHAKSTYTRP